MREFTTTSFSKSMFLRGISEVWIHSSFRRVQNEDGNESENLIAINWSLLYVRILSENGRQWLAVWKWQERVSSLNILRTRFCNHSDYFRKFTRLVV